MHVKSVKIYCFSLSNMQISNVLVGVVVEVAPYCLPNDEEKLCNLRFSDDNASQEQ